MNPILPTGAEIQREIVKKGGLYHFIKLAWNVIEPPTVPFQDNWHIQAVAEHTQALYDGDIRDLLINIPPRFLKSRICAVFAPAWEWTKRPATRMLFDSYSEDLSMSDSIVTRQLIESDWYQERWGHVFQLSDDQNTKTNFETTQHGARVAISVGGTVTGKGAGIITCDDLLSKDQSESEAFRIRASKHRFETLPSRFNDPMTGRFLDIQQRLHPNDTTGELLLREKEGRSRRITKLILPLEYIPTTYVTVLGFKDPRKVEGESLHPERFDAQTIQDKKDDLGSYAYVGQYQQDPVPREGGMVKESWFKNRFSEELTWENLNKKKGLMMIVQSADCASKAKQRNDPVVCGTWGVFEDRTVEEGKKPEIKYHVELWDVEVKRMEFPEGLRFFKRKGDVWQPDLVLIEDKDAGQQYLQTLKEPEQDYRYKLEAVDPEGLDKGTRMSAETATIERGEMWLPEKAKWLVAYTTEMCLFTGNDGGGHDDQCFVAGTMIATSKGDVPIEDIKVGDKVCTPFGLADVQESRCNGEADTITRFGLEGTANHPVIGKRGKQTLDTIYQEDLIYFSWDTLKHYISRRSLNFKKSRTDSWEVREDIILASQNNTEEKGPKDFMLLFGNFFQARKCLKDIWFTIRMKIHLIMIRKIWNAYQEANMEKYTPTSTGSQNIWPISPKSGSWQKHGIGVQKDELGIIKTPLNQNGKTKKISAEDAEKSSSLNEKPSTVQDIVPGKSIPGRQKVYNLKTSHGVYFANGILVSNCDMTSQFLKWFRRKFRKRKIVAPDGVAVGASPHNISSYRQGLNDDSGANDGF